MNVRVFGLIEGLMVCWDDVLDAAQYNIRLFIGKWNGSKEALLQFYHHRKKADYEKITFKELALISVDRNTKYYSVKGLARIHKDDYTSQNGWRNTGLNYYVMVEAEDRNGQIISSSEKVLGNSLGARGED